MNQFELIETIKGHNEALTGAYKYWTTTSFAGITRRIASNS